MEYSVFYVGRRPRAFWDVNLKEKNMEFLRGLDGAYYSHVAATHEPHLSGDSKLHAAAALRIAYAQGVETLMALICAGMQAPDCVLGWMLLYRNKELRQLVGQVSSHRGECPVHPYYSPPSWELFGQRVFENAPCDDSRRAVLQARFGRLWSRFAGDYLDEKQQQEYNSLKHGSRPRLGGFYMSVGPQAEAGVPASPESMISLGGSDFGSTFWSHEHVGESRLHLRPLETSINWVPENLVEGLVLLATSIKNVASYQLALNGEPLEKCELSAPDEDDMFDLPWAKHCGLISGGFRMDFGPSDIADWSQEDLHDLIRKRWASS
jgi:hypothetical protein